MQRQLVGDVARNLIAAVAASILFGVGLPASALAKAEPYCPQMGQVPRQVYDIKKFCALVIGDLAEGQWPDFLKLLDQSRRNTMHASPSPKPRKVSKPRDVVSTVKQSEAEPGRIRRKDAEPRMPAESDWEAGRAADRVLNRDRQARGDQAGADRQQRQRRDRAQPSPTMVVTPSAPSVTPSASSSAPASVNAVMPRSEHLPEVMGPLGAALVFGLMVMVLSAALIGRRRSRPEPARAGSSGGGVSPCGGACPRGGEVGERPVTKSAPAGVPDVVFAAVRTGSEVDDTEGMPAFALQADQSSGSSGPYNSAAETAAAVASGWSSGFVAKPGVASAVPLKNDEGPLGEEGLAVGAAEDGAASVCSGDTAGAFGQPATSAAPRVEAAGFVAAPGRVKAEVLGSMRLSYACEWVSFGRAEADDLFALLATSREGLSKLSVIDTLWPDDGDRGASRFDSAIRTINQSMRQAMGLSADVKFVVKSGQRRLLSAAYFDVDFWRFEDGYKLASTVAEDAARKAALHEVLALYRGSLLAGRDDLWVLPLRQAAQRQAVDVAERLAELTRAEDPDRALDVLRLAVDRIDPHSEVLWCLVMSIQGELGRLPAVRRSFELLKERLAEIDAVPSAQARQVYERFIR